VLTAAGRALERAMARKPNATTVPPATVFLVAAKVE
jgi:hypothetical protein